MSYSKLVSYYKLTNNRGSREGNPIRGFAIHCFVGQVTAQRGVDYFYNTDRDASANYVIGYDGKIGCSVDDEYRSWCTSTGLDKQLITIEMASEATHPYQITNEAYASLIDLLVDRCKAHGIKKLVWKEDKAAAQRWDLSEQNMVVHRWFDNKACPGDYLYNLHYQIAEQVNVRLGVEEDAAPDDPSPEVPSYDDFDFVNVSAPIIGIGDTGNAVKSLQGILTANGFDLEYCGGCDGIFGGGTEYAVKAYQTQHGLDVDGVVGSKTWGEMLKA